MLGIGYFLKIAKIDSQQETPIFPNSKNLFLQNTKYSRSARINSSKNFMPHGSIKNRIVDLYDCFLSLELLV